MAQEKIDTTAMPEEKRAAFRRIEGYRQLVLKGEKMSTLASLYSEDPGSAPNGGAYYNIAKGAFVPEFEKAALALKPGEISEIFETQYGFHFVQLIDKHDDKMDVRHILVKTK
jgi:peptidyl-prolyl cis-trans isomerase SurA